MGPLPKTKTGNQFLLTITCASTQFPEPMKLRNITARSIVKPCILVPKLVPKANTTSQWFCSYFGRKFDLLKGYWQMPLTQLVKELSAFVIPDRLFAYCRMPFGLRNVGVTFQRFMHILLRGLDNAKAYIDDVVVFSGSWSDHLKHVRALLERLKVANPTVNLGKSEIAKATVK